MKERIEKEEDIVDGIEVYEFKINSNGLGGNANTIIHLSCFPNISFGVHIDENFLDKVYGILKDVDRTVNYKIPDKDILLDIQKQIRHIGSRAYGITFHTDIIGENIFDYDVMIEYTPQ